MARIVHNCLKRKEDEIGRVFFLLYVILFLSGIRTLFHGFPDIERFFAEWMDERITLTAIMKFGTLNFAPTIIFHPPLYHYLTFFAMCIFFILGKLAGLFQDKIEFISFYFNNTHYFFFIGRMMSYIFYWLTAFVIFKIIRLFYNKLSAYLTVLTYLLIPAFIFNFSTTRPETLLFLNTSIFFYLILRYYSGGDKRDLLIAAFFLGVATATKYNALFLGTIFAPLLYFKEDKNYKSLLPLGIKLGFLVFLGFFICNPFFVLRFKEYFHNLLVYSLVEMKYYWVNYHPAVFCITHMKNLASMLYMNIFGFFILALGSWRLFRKDRKLFIIVFFAILIYEIYFGIFQRNASPLSYLNPLLPAAALIFSAGLNFIILNSRKLMLILAAFGVVLFYNYFDIWTGLSVDATFLQKARHFIESSVPEFTTICITSDHYLPQLNMTKKTYYYLIGSKRIWGDMDGHELSYKEMDNREHYDDRMTRLRIESLVKSPQYNIIRWDKNINTVEEASSFLKKNKVKYILGITTPMIGNKKLIDTGIVSLVKEFKPRNVRVFGSGSLYLYKVELL